MPIVTTVAAARAAAAGIADWSTLGLSVKSLQEHHRRRCGLENAGRDEGLDLRHEVGSLSLSAPGDDRVGDRRHGSELGAYFDLDRLGAVVVKSLSADPWPGNPPPRAFRWRAGC